MPVHSFGFLIRLWLRSDWIDLSLGCPHEHGSVISANRSAWQTGQQPQQEQ